MASPAFPLDMGQGEKYPRMSYFMLTFLFNKIITSALQVGRNGGDDGRKTNLTKTQEWGVLQVFGCSVYYMEIITTCCPHYGALAKTPRHRKGPIQHSNTRSLKSFREAQRRKVKSPVLSPLLKCLCQCLFSQLFIKRM